jgi:hypothetical protein
LASLSAVSRYARVPLAVIDRSGADATPPYATGLRTSSRDQRGVTRPQDDNGDGGVACDIGSFERSAVQVFCNSLRATIVGTGASETLDGTVGRDVMHGLDGADLIIGLLGNDVICGGAGNDTIYGGPGLDALLGQSDNDRLIGVDGNDQLFGGDGRDRLDGRKGFDQCNGGPPASGDTAVNCEQISSVP